jgi:hypothetical protein
MALKITDTNPGFANRGWNHRGCCGTSRRHINPLPLLIGSSGEECRYEKSEKRNEFDKNSELFHVLIILVSRGASLPPAPLGPLGGGLLTSRLRLVLHHELEEIENNWRKFVGFRFVHAMLLLVLDPLDPLVGEAVEAFHGGVTHRRHYNHTISVLLAG